MEIIKTQSQPRTAIASEWPLCSPWRRLESGTRHAVELVETDDIGMIENVKRLNDEVELSVLPNLEEFQDTQVKLHLTVSS